MQDLRYALRSLARARGFTVAAVLTLALGMAANAIVYGVVDGLILRPLPFGERSSRLITVHSTHPTQAQQWDDSDVSYPDLVDVRESARSLAAVEGILNRNLSLSSTDRTERVMGASITPGLFALLGVEPATGRGFRDEDAAEPGLEPVAIISDRLWQRLYDRDPFIIGRGVPVNGRTVTVIGVMPPNFRFPENHDVWLPYRAPRHEFRNRRNLLTVALLQPGATLEHARAELSAVASTLAQKYPDTNRNWGLHLLPLRDLFVTDDTREALTAMLLAVGFVLLVACANVASLLVARGVGRQRELAVRIALGAGRARVTRLLLVESAVLAVAGGVVAIMVASWGLDALVASMPEPPIYWANIHVDGRVLGFTFLLTILTAIASGLLPALRSGRLDAGNGILQSGRSSGVSREQRRMQGYLVAGQVALSLVLLVSATLLARSATMLQHADIGFDASELLSLRVSIAGDAYNDPVARARAVDRIVDAVTAVPGAQIAAATGAIPGDDGGAGIRLIPPYRSGNSEEQIGAHMVPITSSLFDVLGLDLLEGRSFDSGEMSRADARVAIVNKRLADLFWPGQRAVGHELQVADTRDHTAFRIIGVVPDVVYEELGEETAQSRLTVYVPYIFEGRRTMALLVRAQSRPESIASATPDAVRSVDPFFATYDLMTMRERRRITAWGERFLGRTFSAFALAAVFLACLGAYGLTVHAAAQRTREIGVRIAIGATRRDIVRLLLTGGLRLALIGVVAGLPIAIAAARLVEGLLFRVSPWALGVWLCLPLALLIAVLLASYLPARRASLADPATALRQEV